MGPVTVAIDRGDTDLAAIEHRLMELGALAPGPTACTHVVDAHYVGTIEVESPHADALIDSARQPGVIVAVLKYGADGVPGSGIDRAACVAVAAHRARKGGRAVAYRGQEGLRGTVRADRITTTTAIDAVVAIGAAVEAASVVHTGDFTRPIFVDGRLVLYVRPSSDGTFVPAEKANPHQCCGGH